MKTKPVHELRLGAIRAAVWKNESNGVVHYHTTFSRLYKANDKWQSSDSFGRDDLLLLAKVADQIHSWICQQEQAARPQSAQAPRNSVVSSNPS